MNDHTGMWAKGGALYPTLSPEHSACSVKMTIKLPYGKPPGSFPFQPGRGEVSQ